MHWQTHISIRDEALKTVLISFAAIFFVSCLSVRKAYVAFAVLVGVAFSVVDLMALVQFLKIYLNTVSVVCLSLAVGMTVDFSAHVGIAFVNGKGSNKQRIEDLLKRLGPALFHSSMSTLLAVGSLAPSTGYVFQIFFKMFSLIIVLGVFHGVVVVPIVLVIGPTVEERNRPTILNTPLDQETNATQ